MSTPCHPSQNLIHPILIIYKGKSSNIVITCFHTLTNDQLFYVHSDFDDLKQWYPLVHAIQPALIVITGWVLLNREIASQNFAQTIDIEPPNTDHQHFN